MSRQVRGISRQIYQFLFFVFFVCLFCSSSCGAKKENVNSARSAILTTAFVRTVTQIHTGRTLIKCYLQLALLTLEHGWESVKRSRSLATFSHLSSFALHSRVVLSCVELVSRWMSCFGSELQLTVNFQPETNFTAVLILELTWINAKGGIFLKLARKHKHYRAVCCLPLWEV